MKSNGERRVDGVAEAEVSIAPDGMAQLKEIAGVLRNQASRIAALEDDVDRARAAAEGARELALREATRRVEVQTELHAVHRTRMWRYSAFPRRVYRGLRLRLSGSRGQAERPA